MSDLTEFARHRYIVSIGGDDVALALGSTTHFPSNGSSYKVREIEFEFEGYRNGDHTGWTLGSVSLLGDRHGFWGTRERWEAIYHVHEMPAPLRIYAADLAAKLPASLPNVYDLSL